jgi:predicted 2-oxoglutarate/Fe(II)-dependent dioxygenase YbiX
MIENPLSYILIRPNVINDYGTQELIQHIESSSKADLSVFDAQKSNETDQQEWKNDKTIRDTQTVNAGHLMPKIVDLFRSIVKEIINPFYGIEVYQSEIPQLLSYEVGGHYLPHVDSESPWIAPNGEMIWKKLVDRDLSIVLYLNDDFEGGDFIFPDLKIRVKPEPGMLVCFPSNHYYKHGVEPVTRGKRYSIVCWAQIKGHPTLNDHNRELSQRYGIDINN